MDNGLKGLKASCKAAGEGSVSSVYITGLALSGHSVTLCLCQNCHTDTNTQHQQPR